MSVSASLYERIRDRAKAEGRSVAAIVESLLADLSDVDVPAVPVSDGVYRDVAKVARRTWRPVSEVFEAALVRALDDVERFPPRRRRTCPRPRVAHTYRRRAGGRS